ncbi:piggyBac transposable element-derived protein 3-like [Anabrus simplex]|uniref:piggyBac transposable element-derived protein 3-like n=1 Tax=Anabrus simplex TaxID=316456 RepID=UPI0035A3C04F
MSFLREKEILQALALSDESEDESEPGDSDDETFTLPTFYLDKPDDQRKSASTTVPDSHPTEQDLQMPSTSTVNMLIASMVTAAGQKPNNTSQPMKYKNVQWKKGSLSVSADEISFLGSEKLPDNILALSSPLQFFKYFFSDNLLEKICEESCRYSVQKTPEKPIILSPNELQKFIGVSVLMSIVHLPNVRSYWKETIGSSIVKETMPVNVFETIRRYLHFNDSLLAVPAGEPGHGRLYKLRPVIDSLNEKFRSIPLEESLSVDEQLCPTKGRSYLKQFLPMKPRKWGYKLFVLSGVSGFAYNVEIYTGQENREDCRPAGEPDLGASANVVVRLCRIVPCDVHHKIYFDNYYTTLPLMVFMKNRGIYCLGTLRRNRVPGLKLQSESDMKKNPRGTCEECVAKVDSVDVSAVAWKDNKVVTLMSTFVGSEPTKKVKRFDRKERKTIQVDCPKIVIVYNLHMGGVDLLDSIMARYRIIMRTKKWYIKLFYHFLDVTIVNAWILHRRVAAQLGIQNTMTLAAFREDLALSLCQVGLSITPKRGRPSFEVEGDLVKKRKKSSAAVYPPQPVRQDRLEHWPIHKDTRQRCKFPSCKGKTLIFCEKCDVTLCITNKKNCFKDFHLK